LPLILFYNYYNVNELLLNNWMLYGIIIVLSWLMISTLPLLSLKFANLSVKSNVPKLMLLIIAVIAAFFLKWLAVPVVFICYIIVSLAFKNKTT
jgi:CDP-diacylglycerol--serine O-phosphatidyltransferase